MHSFKMPRLFVNIRPLLIAATLVFSFIGTARAQTAVRQINTGGAAVSPFAADNGFSGGNTFSSTAAINLTGVANPAPQAVYQTVRWAPSFNYTLSGLTANSGYLVRLHFVELSFGAAGQRRFNAAINGTSVLTNFDIYAAAGAANKAVVSEFMATANASGTIVVAFSQGAADNPSIAGIELYPAAAGQAPTSGKNLTINNGAVLQVENYDVGGEGIAYHDVDAGNSGGAYRGDNVDIEGTTDTGGGYNVGWTRDGEWLEYTTNTTAGTYSIVVRGASGVTSTKSARVLLDGVLLGAVSISNTGGWQTWQDFTISGANITAGTGKILRLEIVGGDFNVNYLRFTTSASTYPLTVTSGSGSGSYATGTVVNITANAPPAGQVFAGWTGGTAANFGNASSATTTYTTTAAAQTITATYANAQTFALTVTSGTGSGNYAAGTVVNISANTPPAGQVFAGWTGGTAANFGNASSATTTYTTTAAAQTITATYANAQTFALTVTSGTGSGNYAAGTVVNISANAPPAGQVFAGWTGGTAANFGNASSTTTTYTTTAAAQTITATYTNAQTFALTVTSGTGSGSYTAGTVVGITANAAPAGQTFSGWTGGTAANFGNASASSTTYTTVASAQTITANYTTTNGSNLAVGKPITASSTTQSFVATNANDNSVTTYWEGVGFSANLDVNLQANATVTQVLVKLDPSWGARTQTIAVWGHDQSSTTFTQLVPATLYQFNPAANTATINLSTPATASAVRLVFSTNSGAQSGQAAEFQVIGTWAPNPDLTITALTWSPASPTETNSITLSATVRNIGSASSPATTVAFYLDSTQVGSAAPVPALAAGSSVVVSTNIGALSARSYAASAEVDPTLSVIEQDNTNNVYTSPTPMVVSQAPGPDLQILSITPSNSNPAAGAAVSFTVAVNNRGTTAVAAGTTTRLVVGTTTLNQTATPAISANTTVQVTIPGTWTATTGTSNVTATADATNVITETNETNNSFSTTILSGRGAAVPYTRYRAADTTIATLSGGATVKSAVKFDKMNLATQASDQAYVELSANGSSVQWKVAQNNMAGVTMRFTLPDSSDGMGLNGSVDCYVNNVKVQTVNLTSYYMWQYFGGGGDPSDTPTNGVPAFAFDETHWMLSTPLNAGDTIRIQSTGGPVVGVDFLEIEPVPTAIPQPAGSVSVASYGASPGAADNLAAFNSAVTAAVASSSKTLYIPAGTYKLSSMWVIGSTSSPISKLTITGAGMWYTNIQFTNSAVAGGGCSIRLSATGTMDFSNMYLNSNLRSRYNENAIYKCFMDNFGVNSRFHDLWEEHFECGFWVADYAYNPCQVASGLVIENSRIRNNLADGINFCNGTHDSVVQNCSIRNGGDDALAIWPNNFNGAPVAVNDTFTHNTIEFNWRSAGIAFYGGSGHKATFNFIKDNFMSSGFRANTTFPGYHFENNTGITISDTTIVNCGSSYDAWSGELGAVDLEASNTAITNFTFTNIDVVNAQRDGYAMGFAGGFSGIQFTDCTANGTGLDGITTSKFSQQHLGAGIFTYGAGAATFTNFQFANCAGGKTFNQGGFVLTFK